MARFQKMSDGMNRIAALLQSMLYVHTLRKCIQEPTKQSNMYDDAFLRKKLTYNRH